MIRFIAVDGKTTFGDAIVDDASDVPQKLEQNELFALELEGSDPFALIATGKKVQVKTLLAILTPSDVPVIRCIGLNYIKHSKLFWLPWNRRELSILTFVPVKEGGRTPPPYPSLFVKPRTSIASYNEDIPIPKITQENQLDYEGELVRITAVEFAWILFNRSFRPLSLASPARTSLRRMRSRTLPDMLRPTMFPHVHGNATPHMLVVFHSGASARDSTSLLQSLPFLSRRPLLVPQISCSCRPL